MLCILEEQKSEDKQRKYQMYILFRSSTKGQKTISNFRRSQQYHKMLKSTFPFKSTKESKWNACKPGKIFRLLSSTLSFLWRTSNCFQYPTQTNLSVPIYRVRTANIQMVRGLLVLYDGRKSGWANQHGGLLIIEISTWQMLQLSFASTF